MKKATFIITQALGDAPFRISFPAVPNEIEKLKLLDQRYKSTRSVSCISVLQRLFTTKHGGKEDLADSSTTSIDYSSTSKDYARILKSQTKWKWDS